MKVYSLINALLFLAICLIWGSSFILIKAGLYNGNTLILTPYQVAAIRVSSAGLIFLPFILSKIQKFNIRTWICLAASGLFGVFIPSFLFCLAETKIDSAIAGILNAATPIFVLLIGFAFYKLPYQWKQLAGVIIGVIGIILLFFARGDIDLHNLNYGLLILLATLSYAINATLVKHELTDIPSITISVISLVFLIIPGIVLLIVSGFFSLPLRDIKYLKATGASCLLGILGTAIAWTLFYILIKRSNAVFASSVSFAAPIIAVGWGWLAGETITYAETGCLLIILTGVSFTRPVKPLAVAVT